MDMEKILIKGLKAVSGVLTVVFCWLSYGDSVAWAAAVGMAIASMMLLFLPEEL